MKKKKLKKLFYTDLSAFEIQEKIGITNAEYTKLLIEVKEELGLPSNYKRKPSKFGKYSSDKYYIIQQTNKNNKTYDEILTYAPVKSYAENYLKKNKINPNKIKIDPANDKNMKKLIEKAYYHDKEKWDTIMLRLKLPYQDFYRLLNELKEEKGLTGTRTSSNQRYIYPYTQKKLWKIRKTKNGKTKDYGDYDDLNVAIKIRDYLETINWNTIQWEQNKDKIIEEITD